MPKLPEAQLAVFEPSLTHTGVDYFGQITITQGKWAGGSTGREKGCVIILACLTYRAIHLEPADD